MSNHNAENDAHMSNVARVIRECADDIGMNEPRYADRLLALAEMAEREAAGRFILCPMPRYPGDARYAPPGRGHYDHGYVIPPGSGES